MVKKKINARNSAKKENRTDNTMETSIHTTFTIETFNPTDFQWKRWIKRLEGTFTLFKIPENCKVHYLLHYMGAEAFDTLCDKIAPEEPHNQTYKDLVQLMEQYYSPAPLEIAENFRFHQRKQQEGEKVQDFVIALRKLAINCKFGEYLKTALRNQFVFGLRNEKIQGRLLEMKDLDLEKALEIAVSMEMSAKDMAQLHKQHTAIDAVHTQKGADNRKYVKKEKGNGVHFQKFAPTKEENQRKKCYRCGSTTHLTNTCDKISIACNFCKKRGHLQKVCFRAKAGTSTNRVEEIVSVEGSERGNFREKFYVVLQVNDVRVRFELDSGAAVTVMGGMARAGMALRRGTGHGNADGSDDVQRSIELLDRVLSEFDDVENANQVQNIQQMTTSTSTPQLRQVGTNSTTSNVSSTPDDESPSLGHQSEDDGYMSMNGRKPKFSLAFKPLAEVPVHHENASQSPTIMLKGDLDDFPPPPEEAQRLIATLLPKVSPLHRPKNSGSSRSRQFPLTQLPARVETIPPPQRFQNNDVPILNGLPDPIHTATQTTLPKTRHQRPYGWENNDFTLNPPPPPPGYRFGSLPFQHGIYPITSPTRVPPRTVPTALERHREVKRHGSEDNLSSDLLPLSELADDEHFSDDSLEEMLPPPPPATNKRASIAWEVPLDDDPLLTPGSTKVIGRRRRKSGSHSSTSSIPNRLKELEDWPDPPPCTTEDEVTSPFSDDEPIILPPVVNSDLSGTSTYIVRRGKNRKTLNSMTSNSSLNSRLSSDLSIPQSRFSADLNCRLSRELNTPSSRYSVDLSTPHSRLSQELNSPKSRYSLDLNNSRHMSQELSSSPLSSSRSSTPHSKHGDIKKHTTFDNIKSLIKEGVIEDYNSPPIECTSELNCLVPQIVRVVSLPSLNAEEYTPRRELDVTVEEEEDAESSQQSEISPLRQIEQNITELLERRDIEVIEQDARCMLNGVEALSSSSSKKEKRKAPSKPARNTKKMHDLQKSSSHNEIQRSEDYYRQLLIEGSTAFPKRNGIQKSESAKEMMIAHKENRPLPTSTSADFPVRVEVLHDFPPLPPSPVEEDDEYSEIIPIKTRADTLPASSEPPAVPPHRDPNTLKTRSMDNYSRGRRNFYSSSRNIPSERRTLPSELQDKRKMFQKRSPEEHHLQTSCSLPETPIFSRGCDIPRTPHRRAPDVPGGNQTAPRQSNTIGSLNTIVSTGGYRRGMSNSGLEQAIMGAELMRLAGGPGRGWYPKQRHRRPASIEHLDRMASGHNPWESNRKPLTLPPNLTPKFFQRSPRDALRRVTSLLIRKGNNNGKEPRKEKDIVSPTIHENANGEEVQKKKGFFKSFWKRSRHYSLEQQ